MYKLQNLCFQGITVYECPWASYPDRDEKQQNNIFHLFLLFFFLPFSIYLFFFASQTSYDCSVKPGERANTWRRWSAILYYYFHCTGEVMKRASLIFTGSQSLSVVESASNPNYVCSWTMDAPLPTSSTTNVQGDRSWVMNTFSLTTWGTPFQRLLITRLSNRDKSG